VTDAVKLIAMDGAYEEHRDLLHQLTELQAKKPRPIDKLYGTRGPTPEQKAKWEEDMRAWNRATGAIRRKLPALLEQSNKEFRERQGKATDRAVTLSRDEARILLRVMKGTK
jgi:hypothetical protein